MAIALKEGRSVRGREIIVECPDGKRRNVMPYPNPIFDSSGEVVEAVNMLVDITELKQNEKALRDSEDKYKRLAGELEASLKIEEEFMSIASHELNTPITTIKLFIDMFMEEGSILNADEQTKYILTRVRFQVDRLVRLIKELIDATKWKSGKLDLYFEEVLLNELIKGLVTDINFISASHIFKLHESGEIKITCDKNRIEQVIVNLLTNAQKYSKKGSTVDITISRDTENVLVSIHDNGKGIPLELTPRIFKRFFRAHINDKDRSSSMGLGLYISKDIITRHHGRIWVESEVDKGSTFYFTLPLN